MRSRLGKVEPQDIDAKRVEAIQMAKIVPEPRFPRREQNADYPVTFILMLTWHFNIIN